MAIKDVETKCWILALFVRDDGERFLLGDGSYEFTEKQLHFAANTMANDVVEVQGNDGYLLAGQVRRPSTQTFDGYVGDSSTSKAVVEERRRAFFAFFRKNFFYKVIYIFPDGSAIQRKRGFLVDAPEVKEIRQIYPEYHVALNFEDINYYYYDEDADGQEIYGKSATINLNSVAQSGGLIWLLPSEMTLTGEGTSFTLSGTVNGTALTSAKLKGDTFQQTYSGKNLCGVITSNSQSGVSGAINVDGSLTISGTATASVGASVFTVNMDLPAGTYTMTLSKALPFVLNYSMSGAQFRFTAGATKVTTTLSSEITAATIFAAVTNGVTYNETFNIQIVSGSTADYDFEPYVGGMPSPNPDYPQEVQTATGRQVVTISNGTESQEYEINLGKNLINLTAAPDSTNLVSGVSYDTATSTLSVPSDSSTTTGTRYATFYLTNLQKGATYYMKVGSFTNAGIPSANRMMTIRSYDGSSYTDLLILRPSTLGGTLTVPANSKRVEFLFITVQGYTSTFTNVQLEKGSTATSYAPYISHFGKNIYPNQIYKTGYIIASDGSETASTGGCISEAFSIESGETYALSWQTTNLGSGLRLAYYTSNMTFISREFLQSATPLVTTAPNNATYARLSYYNREVSWIQLEQGSTATTYQQFIGGQLELCKIGNYQDRIYKSGSDWYLRKEVKKIILDGSESITKPFTNVFVIENLAGDWPKLSTTIFYKSDTYLPLTATDSNSKFNSLAAGYSYVFDFTSAASGRNIRIKDVRYDNVDDFKTWLSSNNVTMYYALATPTDTQITNTALIAQLNALAAATTYNGSTSFTVDGNGNLAAILAVEVEAVGGGGVEWDENGAVWEEGKPSYSIISVDSIDNVYPVLTITGRTVNPVLTDVTTGTIFQYNGTITESQVLRVDMMNKTATLNGVSVIGNVTGDWLYLAPGNNRVTYTADNADAPNATVEWQEIVG